MKIAAVVANGREGKMITKNLVKDGQDITAIVRKENRSAAPKALLVECLRSNQR